MRSRNPDAFVFSDFESRVEADAGVLLRGGEYEVVQVIDHG
jgi:hypothetical protein